MNIYVESNFVLELALLQEQSTSCSTVLSHLEQARASRSCFLNRNSRDFGDQTVVEQLERYNCKLLPRFDSGSRFIFNALR